VTGVLGLARATGRVWCVRWPKIGGNAGYLTRLMPMDGGQRLGDPLPSPRGRLKIGVEGGKQTP